MNRNVDHTKQLLESIEEHGKRAQGMKDLIRHLNGERISRGRAIKAKCYDCMGYASDGAVDCAVPDCPLYGYHPYAKK